MLSVSQVPIHNSFSLEYFEKQDRSAEGKLLLEIFNTVNTFGSK